MNTTEVETSKAARLSYCEQTIALGKQTFLDVGNALAEIMEEQLYKLKGYGSFAEYCDKEWGFKKTYAYQLVSSYKAVEPFSAIAENINEATARELARVPADKRPEVLALAGDKPTAAAIRKAARTTLDEASEPTSRTEPEQPAALKGIDVSKLDGAKVSEPTELEQIHQQLKRFEEQITRSDLTGDDLILIAKEIFKLSERINRVGKERKAKQQLNS